MVKEKTSKRKILFFIVLLTALIGGIFAYLWFFEWRFYIYTNDAYIEGDIASLAPKVGGYVKDILVADNSKVKKNSVLFKLDDSDYKLNLEHETAQLEAQKKALNTIKAQMQTAEANLGGAQAQLPAAAAGLKTSQLELHRVQQLNKDKFATNAQLDATDLKVKQAKANIANVNAQINSAKANIQVLWAKQAELNSQIKALEVLIKKAQQDVQDTTIRAPFDGVIGNLVAKKGDLVAAGQQLASLVPTTQLYIVANYKETQIAQIEPGIVADIEVDALGKKTLLGRVVSIAPATGSVFSIMPPQNATGNFTKVVQRVPVRIALPHDVLQTGILKVGMSVGVNIDTRNKLE